MFASKTLKRLRINECEFIAGTFSSHFTISQVSIALVTSENWKTVEVNKEKPAWCIDWLTFNLRNQLIVNIDSSSATQSINNRFSKLPIFKIPQIFFIAIRD